MDQISIGVIGVGGMGTRHAENAHRRTAGARVAGVHDLNAARAAEVAARCGGSIAFASPEALITSPAVDAVVIAAPDEAHAALARACVAAGKPVLCEKPLATNVADARAVVDAEVAGGQRLIAMGFMRRFDPPHAGLRELRDAGVLGRPVLFKGASRNGMIPAGLAPETIVTNSIVHDLDSARWLLGQEVREVYARAVRTHDALGVGALDLFLIHLTFNGDCLASIESAEAAEYGYEICAELIGDRGSAEAVQPDAALLRSNNQRMLRVPHDWLDRFRNAYTIEMQHWVDTLREGMAFSGASAWDGYMDALVADSVIQSLRSGQPVAVAQPEKPALYA
jgi:myo-inositol 2-dehydrogenase/D-chiro-inositol 1-dehydrogenase